jgi:hypothetical protein
MQRCGRQQQHVRPLQRWPSIRARDSIKHVSIRRRRLNHPERRQCRRAAGNWYESRWGEPEELDYDGKVAARHRRAAEPALQIPAPSTSVWWPSTEGPRLQRLGEPNTFRTQAVDYPSDKSAPHVAAETMSWCRTTNQDTQAGTLQVRCTCACCCILWTRRTIKAAAVSLRAITCCCAGDSLQSDCTVHPHKLRHVIAVSAEAANQAELQHGQPPQPEAGARSCADKRKAADRLRHARGTPCRRRVCTRVGHHQAGVCHKCSAGGAAWPTHSSCLLRFYEMASLAAHTQCRCQRDDEHSHLHRMNHICRNVF